MKTDMQLQIVQYLHPRKAAIQPRGIDHVRLAFILNSYTMLCLKCLQIKLFVNGS